MQRFLVAAVRWPAGMMHPLCIVEGKTMADAVASIGCRAPEATKKIVAELEVPEALRSKLELNYFLNETLIIMRVAGVANADEFTSVLGVQRLLK